MKLKKVQKVFFFFKFSGRGEGSNYITSLKTLTEEKKNNTTKNIFIYFTFFLTLLTSFTSLSNRK